MVGKEEGQCGEHSFFKSQFECMSSTMKGLEQAQHTGTEVQAEMANSLAVMANTLKKIEDTNVIVERLSGKLDSVFLLFRKSEKDCDDIFKRIRDLENLSTNPRLKRLEGRQDKMLWGGVISVFGMFLVTVIKAVWR